MKRIIFFFEDDKVGDFYPLSLSHTTAELQCGIMSLGDKWSIRLEHDEIRLISREPLKGFLSHNLSRVVNEFGVSDVDRILFINPRFFPNDAIVERLKNEDRERSFVVDGTPVVISARADSQMMGDLAMALQSESLPAKEYPFYDILSSWSARLPRDEVRLQSVKYLWDIVQRNSDEIERDFEFLIPELAFSQMLDDSEVDDDALIYNLDDVYIGKGSCIDGQVVIDARSGPVYISEKVTIAAQTRIEGPAYIGEGCQLVGGRIRTGCSFGPHCRVGGEVEESIFHGYANKYHDGFLGHSYIGEWVNLGALTTNSDLKNNYGNIKVELPTGTIDTGMNKVGCFIGDHTKTGIGTLLTTGMVLGFAVNLFGGGLAGGRMLPSFVWGGKDGFVDYRLDQAIETARAVMARRGREFAAEDEQLFRHICESTMSRRQAMLGGGE